MRHMSGLCMPWRHELFRGDLADLARSLARIIVSHQRERSSLTRAMTGKTILKKNRRNVLAEGGDIAGRLRGRSILRKNRQWQTARCHAGHSHAEQGNPSTQFTFHVASVYC